MSSPVLAGHSFGGATALLGRAGVYILHFNPREGKIPAKAWGGGGMTMLVENKRGINKNEK